MSYQRTLQNLSITPTKVYVTIDRSLIELIEDNDLDGFKDYLAEDDTLYFNEPITFETEAEALAFCAGIGHGTDERAPGERYPIRSCESTDLPFIEAIDNY